MKKIFPILLLVLIVGAWGSIVYRNYSVPREYENIIVNAKTAYENQYYLEALAYLDEAGELQGIDAPYSTDELRRNIYHGMQDGNAFEKQCKIMIEKYPDTVENYEKLVRYYWDTHDYYKLCKCLSEYTALWPDNTIIAETDADFNRLYTYTATSYYDVQYANSSLINVQEQEYVIRGAGEDEKKQIVRKLKNGNGNDVFNMGYMQMAVSMDGTSCFVCDQEGVWTRVDIANNLLAKNDEKVFESIGRLGENNIAPAVCDGEYHFINQQMKVSGISWENAANFSEGISAVKKNGKWALVTTESWETVTDFPYTDIPFNSQNCVALNGRAVVADAKGYYIVDASDFLPVSENVYEELKAFESKQPTAYRKGDKWGFVNGQGEIYIEAKYEDAKPFVNGYAAVKENGFWGYIDKEGTMIIDPVFDDALNVLNNGVAYVKNELELWDFITLTRLFYEN